MENVIAELIREYCGWVGQRGHIEHSGCEKTIEGGWFPIALLAEPEI